MKPTATAIRNNLTNDNLLSRLSTFLEKFPITEFQETTFEDAYNLFLLSKDSIMNHIEMDTFDLLPFTVRNS